MEQLRIAVENGIISEAQRKAIEKLDAQQSGLRLSMVHLLWLCGVSLIVFALTLLAAEISQGDMERLTWVCLVYSGGLFALDRVVQPRFGLRLLSSLLVTGMGVTLAFAVAAYLHVNWGLNEPGQAWNSLEGAPIILQTIYLPLFPILVVSAILIGSRSFLPAWLGVLCVLGMYITDIFYGQQLDHLYADYSLWLFATVFCCALGWWLDLNARRNHGFWVNKAGLFAFLVFTLVFSFSFPRSTPHLWLLLPTGLMMMLFSVYIRRPGGVSGGMLALAIYLGDWFQAWDNLYVAAGIIALCGLAAIYAGVRAHLIEERLDMLLPKALMRLRPEARHDPVTFGF
ncbi:hypothetical protein [uncultured Roseobacter sp.]|uniref:hypothetical protein n=1 Tax=uncultured Roseobacter sp. TaxID=114847 RepID=UPI002607CB11|nr:hypothetical protein [uncultured Roseobacter sp.]